MLSSNTICLVIILCFASIQLIEVSSFFARYSGVLIGKKTLAYALQNAVFMLTRFFTMALLPLLGLLVDINVGKELYLWMVSGSFLLSLILGSLAVYFSKRLVGGFVKVLKDVESGKSLLFSLLKTPIYILKEDVENFEVIKPNISSLLKCRIFWLSLIVFAVYALSVFMVFFVSLNFPEYRASISQLSGVTNALATVLLTFIIEPKISLAIDKNEDGKALNMIYSLILGRLIGVGFLAQFIVVLLMVIL